jgi:hypothetical protein
MQVDPKKVRLALKRDGIVKDGIKAASRPLP